jgi:hypothetical protein
MKRQRKYTPLMRSFALTLHFYSTKAYTYVRRVWGNILPHPSTIRNWYRSVNGSPGFTNEALHAIKLRVANNKNKGKNTICNIVVDEMAIRQQLLFNNNRFDGSVEFGADHSEDVDNVPLAKEALVFMAVGINNSWKIPVGYFLISGLPGKKRSMLLKQCIELLCDTGVIVSSVTFDGAACNLSMVTGLGANFAFGTPSFQPYFQIQPSTSYIYVFFLISVI